ncbi:hypothetical protein EDD53_1143 [Pacificibacter maritimus]|uniref:Transcriptional activator HlyU n=1 Tax=Pacificibacter maritimus TaxID=762213 RepID=A0A3N4UMX3_9RHOB|nr:HlyU family transcriptional regulator [Pacificibacter maritimus]RPE72006.1 hypothetical protein EDD53_1143 [Pacificibacter maritimus]
MSILSKLFGSKPKAAQVDAPAGKGTSVDHKGFKITPQPLKAEGGYRIAGVIEKDIDGVTKTHNMVRADTLSDLDDAKQATLQKAQVFIDQMGDRIFD